MDLEVLAAQLRKPEGETGKQIGEVMNNGNRLINEWTIQTLDLQNGDTILEMGMGNGYFVKNFLTSKESLIYYGLDYSEMMIEEAIKLNQQFVEIKQAIFTLGLASNMPFEEDFFSKIFTINTIYFWDNAENELKEIRRVLKPGGTFVVAVRSKQTMEQMPFTKFGFEKYDGQKLVYLLENQGFVIKAVQNKKEPTYDFNGHAMQLENIIVSCTK